MARMITVFLALMLLPVAGLAQGVPVITETAPPAGVGSDQQPVPVSPAMTQPVPVQQVVETPLTFHGKLARGHGLYLSGDHAGALSAYEEAKKAESGNPIVYYFIGCAMAKVGRYDDAMVTLKAMTTLGGDSDVSLMAKSLFMIAVVQEMGGRLDAAKEAWVAYQDYARSHVNAVTFAATPEARLAAIEKKKKLDVEYAVVRERIAASK